MGKNWQDMISGCNGVFILNNTTEKEFSCEGIYVLEDTVFSRLEVNGDTSTDVKATYIANTAIALKAGAFLVANGDSLWSAVTLVSGSVALLKS